MTDRNATQIADWNGAVGQRWAAEQETLDVLIRPFGEAVLAAARPAPGEKVLDIGCGCGETSLALGRAVGPTGQVLGVDVSAPMLDVARRRAAASANVTFAQADASQVRLPEGFSLLFSRFGVMFFDQPGAALAHLHNALRPDGRFVSVCWRGPRDNTWAMVPLMITMIPAVSVLARDWRMLPRHLGELKCAC